jgi:hypothetical protein
MSDTPDHDDPEKSKAKVYSLTFVRVWSTHFIGETLAEPQARRIVIHSQLFGVPAV